MMCIILRKSMNQFITRNCFNVVFKQIFEEPLEKSVKKTIAEIVHKEDLKTVLDICSGLGYFSCYSGKLGGYIIGVDRNLSLLINAHRLTHGMPFVCADVFHLPFRSSSFDGVTICFATHDKTSTQNESMYNQALRVLKKNGKIIIADVGVPWNLTTKALYYIVCLLQFLNGQFKVFNSFIKSGAISGQFLNKCGLVEMKRIKKVWPHTDIVTGMKKPTEE
jgi:ubiquinone/menaquinone biosynthesis C-methylase UbiE